MKDKPLKIKCLQGFKDILPEEVSTWRKIESVARDVFSRFHFSEIRMPILEQTDLFARSIGETTDIVEKEMYTFVDKQITMRPEATASLLRAYIQHGLFTHKAVQRLFTIGPMFRHERPQKGRLRQFHQMSVEVLGASSPVVDAELMAMGALLMQELDLTASLELNSLGCPGCRPVFRKELLSFLEKSKEHLCEDCKRRVVNNPLRVLDCKSTKCREIVQDAPSIQEHLCPICDEHFAEVQKRLHQLKVDFSLNRFMVRGLDYYCRTTFEFITGDLGSQAAVGAGGRYDNLVEQLGGPRTPGIGFAFGMERLVLLLQQKEKGVVAESPLEVFVAALGQKASEYAFGLTHDLRLNSFSALMDPEGRSLKSQMKQADKESALFVCIIGEDEMKKEMMLFRNMSTGEQQELSLDSGALVQMLNKKLRG